MKKLLMICTIFLISQNVFAGEIPELKAYLESEILNQKTEILAAQPTAGTEWDLRRFMLRISPAFGIKVPWVASFEIAPEVEFIFLKTEKAN